MIQRQLVYTSPLYGKTWLFPFSLPFCSQCMPLPSFSQILFKRLLTIRPTFWKRLMLIIVLVASYHLYLLFQISEGAGKERGYAGTHILSTPQAVQISTARYNTESEKFTALGFAFKNRNYARLFLAVNEEGLQKEDILSVKVLS